jgi:hypothetical protein
MACSTLPLEIARNHLTRCYYVALCCGQHGEIRAAIAARRTIQRPDERSGITHPNIVRMQWRVSGT